MRLENLDHGVIVVDILRQIPDLIVTPSPATLVRRRSSWATIMRSTWAKMQYVWILNDLLSPHAAGKGGKKRQTGTSAQSAPKKKITSTVFFSIANLMATLLPKATSNH